MSAWLRVNRRRPCEICGRADWCGYTDDADGAAAICMRVESDIQTANGGWLHRRDGSDTPRRPVTLPAPRRIEPRPDFAVQWRAWFGRTDAARLDAFAVRLGVAASALRALGCAWTGRAWAFPMRDDEGAIIGIRLRDGDGRKWAVKGSRAGLFYPETQAEGALYICEGPTDVAAALTLGLRALGRPSCLGSEEMIARYIRRERVRDVAIVADADAPGQRGAALLRERLGVTARVWSPPCKDLREFVQLGGSLALVEHSCRDLI